MFRNRNKRKHTELLESKFPQEEDIIKVDRRVHLKISTEEIYGIVKWISLNGVIVGVEFDEKALKGFSVYDGIKQYSPHFFSSTQNNGRIFLAEDLILLPKVKPTPEEQSGILNNFYKSLKSFGFVDGKERNKKAKRKNNSLQKNTDKNQNEIIQVPETIIRIPELIPSPDISKILTAWNSRGIVWNANSCYLDATLFSMFFTTDIFDETLLSNKKLKDATNDLSQKVRLILKNEIVYPLRANLICPATNTTKLRDAIKHLNYKVQSSFMDAEDFIFLLLERSLNVEEFLMYNTGTLDYMHQIIIDNLDRRKFGFVQDLLETSMRLNDGLKFDGIPRPALFIEMPRSDGSLVHFKAVIPNLSINISKVLCEVSCTCGKIGKWFCPQCHEEYELKGQMKCRWTVYCDDAKTSHILSHQKHIPIPVETSHKNFLVEMDLIAVICVRFSHYTAFVKCGNERLAPWLFSDSMSKVTPLKNMGQWLQTMENNPGKIETILMKECPSDFRRIALDCHICIYKPRH